MLIIGTLVMTWPKFDTLFIIVAADTVAPHISYGVLFVDGLIDNDDKVASSKRHDQFKNLFKAKMVKIDTLFMTKTPERPYPFRPNIPI